jgi:hypothetical protein
MSLITEEIIRKGYRAAETVGARHWGPKAFEIALTAVLPDILETAAIRALADTGTVQSSNLLKKKAK